MSFRISMPGRVEPSRRCSTSLTKRCCSTGARRAIADEKPGFPCRVTLADAEPV